MKVAIISGKGGSGKSSISAAFVSLCSKVIAVDCDVDASNLPLLFPHNVRKDEPFASGMGVHVDSAACVGCGVCVDNCSFDALSMNSAGVASAKDFSCEGCGLCEYLCPQKAITMVLEYGSSIYTSSFAHGVLIHGDLRPGDDNSGKMIARLREIADQMMRAENINLQILDGPPGIGCPVLSTVTGVNKVVIVCEPTLSGISDLLRAYHVAHSFCQDINVIINKCNINEANRYEILNLCKELNVPVVAQLPFDRKLVEAQLHCQSIITYAPDSECAQALVSAYAEIFNQA